MPVAVSRVHLPRRRSSLSNESTHLTDEPLIARPTFNKPCFRCGRSRNQVVPTTNSIGSHSSKSLLGSMQESLLQGKTSGVPSTPHRFSAVIATSFSSPKFIVQFDAIFYTWVDGSYSPFVGCMDMSSPQLTTGSTFPGVKVKDQGRLQIVICNAEDSLVRLIMMRFNVRRLSEGHKFFIRQSTDDYTLHVNFICVGGEYYIYGDMKVIFHNHSLLEDEGKERKVIGIPTPADLNHFLHGCHLCNEQAVEDDHDTIHVDANEILNNDLVHLDIETKHELPVVNNAQTLYEASGTKQLL